MPARRRPYNPGEPALCDLCEVRFGSLEIHKRVFHDDQEEVKCVFCGVPFLYKSALRKHLHAHTDASEVFCCVCLAAFETTESLSSHLETHLELHAFFCDLCKRTFHSRKRLVSHDCKALMLSPTHLVEVAAAVGRDSTVEGSPGLEDDPSGCLPVELIPGVDVNGKSEPAPTPKVHVLRATHIIQGKRLCSFSASTVNEIKIYHAEDLTHSSAEVSPCEMNPSTVPGGMETAGDGPQIPNSAPVSSVSGEETVPNTCKSEATNCGSEVTSKERTPGTRNECPSFGTLPNECSSAPKENGFCSPLTEKGQANFHDEVRESALSEKCPIVIKTDDKEANAPGATDNRANIRSESISHTDGIQSIPEVDIPEHNFIIQKMKTVEITTPSIKVDSALTTAEGSEGQILQTYGENAFVLGENSENNCDADKIKKNLDCDLASVEKRVNPVLLENEVANVADVLVKPDLTKAIEETPGLCLECVPAVLNASCKPPEDSAVVADTVKLPAYITRRKHRMHMMPPVCGDSNENPVVSAREHNLGNIVEKPVSQALKGGGLLVISGNPGATRLHNDAPVHENMNNAEPDSIKSDVKGSLGAGIVQLPSGVPPFRSGETGADAEELPSCITRQRSRRRETTAFAKTRTVLEFSTTESDKVLNEGEVAPGPGSLNMVKIISSATSCVKLELSKQVPESQNHAETPADTSADMVLPDENLRRQTRRMTTKGMPRSCASNLTMPVKHPVKSKTFQNENDVTEELTKHKEGSERDLKLETKAILDSDSGSQAVQDHDPQDSSKALASALNASVCSAFNRRVRKTRRFTAVHRMPPAEKSTETPIEGQNRGERCPSDPVAPRARENGVERVVDTAKATYDVKEGPLPALNPENNLHPFDAETVPTVYSSRGRKVIGRLTTIIVGKPAANNNEIPEGFQSSDNSQCVVPPNGMEKELGGILLASAALTARESVIPLEPTSDTSQAINGDSKAACYSVSRKQPFRQGKGKADGTAETVPPAFARYGRKTRRLTTVPALPKEDLEKLEGTDVNLIVPSSLHNGGRVGECSGAAPTLVANNEAPPENGEVPRQPPAQDEIPQAAVDPNAAVDIPPMPKRQRRKTRRLTTVHEEGQEQTERKKLNDTLTLVDIANKSSRRSVRKRRLTQGVGNGCPLNSENISPSSHAVPPVISNPDCPVSTKKKKISFNETIECWNPILQEMTWRGICDEIREVPLLKPVPKSKRSKQANIRKKKARKSSQPAIEDGSVREESQQFIELVGICVPTSLKAPNNLRPVLKPSPLPVPPSTDATEKAETGKPKRKYAKRKLVLKNMTQLVEKYGADFSYKGCLKVDGRFHCPDEDCMDNEHRGYITEKALRNHIKMHHIDVECPTCDVCGKSFPTNSVLNEHKTIHSDALPYPCKDCDQAFRTAGLLKQHAGTHGGFGECFYCSKTFSSKRRIVNHFKDTPCWCNCCQIALWCPTVFVKHEKEIVHQYHCPVCSRSYQTQSTLIKHVRDVHYDKSTAFDGRYQCLSCEWKFTHWKNIMRHIKRNHPAYSFVEPSVTFI